MVDPTAASYGTVNTLFSAVVVYSYVPGIVYQVIAEHISNLLEITVDFLRISLL